MFDKKKEVCPPLCGFYPGFAVWSSDVATKLHHSSGNSFWQCLLYTPFFTKCLINSEPLTDSTWFTEMYLPKPSTPPLTRRNHKRFAYCILAPSKTNWSAAITLCWRSDQCHVTSIFFALLWLFALACSSINWSPSVFWFCYHAKLE